MKKVKKVGKVEKGGKSGKRGKGGCTCIMNVAASKVSFGMHNMPASEASPCVRGTASPPQELEFGPRISPIIIQLRVTSKCESSGLYSTHINLLFLYLGKLKYKTVRAIYYKR